MRNGARALKGGRHAHSIRIPTLGRFSLPHLGHVMGDSTDYRTRVVDRNQGSDMGDLYRNESKDARLRAEQWLL